MNADVYALYEKLQAEIILPIHNNGKELKLSIQKDTGLTVNHEISVGLTLNHKTKEPAPVILVGSKNTVAYKKAYEIKDKLAPDDILVKVVGDIQSQPAKNTNAKVLPDITRILEPGQSIGAERWGAGSLGVLVKIPPKKSEKKEIGFITASHVLATRHSKKGDLIFHPARIDGGGISDDVIGRFVKWEVLACYNEKEVKEEDETPTYDRVINIADVALAKITTKDKIGKNHVPNPDDPKNDRIQIKRVMSPDDFMDKLVEQPIFKYGRTTGFTQGVVDTVNIKSLKINNRKKLYLLGGLIMVRSEKPFSAKGDSGAIAYTADGTGIGLVIAGSEEGNIHYSYILPLETCLDRMSVTLI